MIPFRPKAVSSVRIVPSAEQDGKSTAFLLPSGSRAVDYPPCKRDFQPPLNPPIRIARSTQNGQTAFRDVRKVVQEKGTRVVPSVIVCGTKMKKKKIEVLTK